MHVEELQLNEYRETPSEKKQIYIVDDDESVCRALKLLLLIHRFKVETFNSAGKFFSTVPNSAPGCLILDIHMPGLEGWEAQQRLFRSGSKRQFIIITADTNNALREQALQAGAMGFFHKPINGQELVDLLNDCFFTTQEKVISQAFSNTRPPIYDLGSWQARNAE